MRVGAALALMSLLAAPPAAADASAETAALVARGEAARLAGRMPRALAALEAAVARAPSPPERAFARAALGTALREAGRDREAEAALTAALRDADGQPALQAAAGAALALTLLERRTAETAVGRAARIDAAAAAMARAETAVAAGVAPPVAATAAAAAARLEGALGRPAAAVKAAARGAAALESLGTGPLLDPVTAHAWLGLGDALLAVGGAEALAAAARAYAQAAAGAEADGRIAALAALGSGETALAAGQTGSALAAARRAAALGAARAADDVVFAALWLRAEALDVEGAAEAEGDAAWADAFAALRALRGGVALGAAPPISARRFAPRRFQSAYLDRLLDPKARDGAHDEAAQARLAVARDVALDLRVDEVEEYFRARCAPDRPRGLLEAADPGAAVLYTVALEDRLELIVAAGGRLTSARAPIGRAALSRAVDALRYRLDAPGASADAEAAALHALLIAPIEPTLRRAGAATLVIAPDGPLRALPFAMLTDGRSRLVERYALATALGLELIEAGAPPPPLAGALAAGVRDAAGFPPLPAAPAEAAAVVATLGGRTLIGDAFTVERFAAELARAPVSVAHIAAHAEFGAAPEDNFIAAADGRLDMTRLEAILRDRAVRAGGPLALMTLSACDTAAGDERVALERAPLGLASVAFRSGARSVLGSLWTADDAAAAALMEAFYRGLAAGLGRAEALRRAQLVLMRNPATADPWTWANFILIGDWR